MSVLLEARSYRPFKSSEEYLIAMKEDLAEWLNALYPELRINVDNFMDRLDTGVALCKHANNLSDVAFLPNAKAGTFFARDNVSNFIGWCRNSLGIIECLLFETDDLIMRKNERHMERQIDREIAAENKAANGAHGNSGNEESDDEYADMQQEEPCLIYGPQPQIVTNDLKSLDEMTSVRSCSVSRGRMFANSQTLHREEDNRIALGNFFAWRLNEAAQKESAVFSTVFEPELTASGCFNARLRGESLEQPNPWYRGTTHWIPWRFAISIEGDSILVKLTVIETNMTQQSSKPIFTQSKKFSTPVVVYSQHRGESRSFALTHAQGGLQTGTEYRKVRDLVERCTCPTQFPMIRVSEGKYRIGDTKVLIFVRILRSHVMVRVGGGWDTLSHYLDKHDPCRCRTSHRSMISAKLIQKAGGSFDLGSAQVHYERSPPRTRRSSASSVGSCAGTMQNQQSAHAAKGVSSNRSRSPTPHQLGGNKQQQQQTTTGGDEQRKINRSRSPTPQRKFLGSPVHQSDFGKQRSRSPTPKAQLRSNSPTTKVDSAKGGSAVDSAGRGLYEEARSPTHHGRQHQEAKDAKKDLHQEIRTKVPLTEEFTRRYVVDGGVARRAVEKDDTPKYEPTIYNYKCREDSSSRSPTPSPPAIKEEPVLENFSKDVTGNVHYTKSPHDGEHSDNCSEVSDEGYRSLGAVQPTGGNGNSGTCTQGSPTVADCQKQPSKPEPEERSPLRASPSRSVASSSGDPSSGSRTPRDSNSSPEGSPLKRGTIRNSLRKPPTGSLSKASAVIAGGKSCQSPVSGSNTWNGSSANNCATTAATTTTTTAPNFSRKSPARQSLPRQSSNGGVGHLQDEREVVQKLQDLLRDYQAHGSGEGVANMEFTRAWIDGNGTVALPQDNQMTASPRKDPKSVSERGGDGVDDDDEEDEDGDDDDDEAGSKRVLEVIGLLDRRPRGPCRSFARARDALDFRDICADYDAITTWIRATTRE
ncbi:GAS2 protein [Apis cerana cerana]|uniref:GAS2 protein n=1 Tax=Apis cerana cerana TaxID=94128 RepID=A0A2A3EB32_APICC|nr:GAS2 protein [Apis cerana cerana]